MFKRQIFQPVHTQQFGNYAFHLPAIDQTRDTAVYIRQSGRVADRKHGESRKMQLALKEFAMKLRKQDNMDHIRIYDEGAGTSGTKRIDERPKLNELWQDMRSGMIGTVIVALESRLFRDEHGDQSGAFSRLAQMLDILLFVPAFTVDGTLDDYAAVTYYDFSNAEHLKEWKRKMDIASEYLSGHVKYMQAARYAKTRRGAYDGRNLPPGLVVERGAPKETRRPVVYQPWADVMDWVFCKGEELSWNAAAMMHTIEHMPYLFPEPSAEDFAKYEFCTNLTHCINGGYKPSYSGTFLEWWTNVHLIGWWKITSKQRQVTEVLIGNHAAVLPLARFSPAFEALTGYTLEGHYLDNPSKRRGQVRKKYPEKEALLHGKVTSMKAKGVSTTLHKGNPRYIAYTKDIANIPVISFSIYAKLIDRVILARLSDLAQADAGIAPRFRQHCERLLQEHVKSTVSIVDSVAEIDRKVAALRRRVTTLSREVGGTDEGDKVIVELVKTINGLLHEKEAMLKKKQDTALVQGPEEIEEFFDVLQNFEAHWKHVSLAKRKRFIDICVRSVTLDAITPHWMNLEIHWLSAITPRGDHALLWRAWGSLIDRGFTDQEREILRALWSTYTTYSEVLMHLPTRSFATLKSLATAEKLYKDPHIRAKADFPENACWADLDIAPDVTDALALIRTATEACRKEKIGAHAFWTVPADADAAARLVWLDQADGSSTYLEGMASVMP